MCFLLRSYVSARVFVSCVFVIGKIGQGTTGQVKARQDRAGEGRAG